MPAAMNPATGNGKMRFACRGTSFFSRILAGQGRSPDEQAFCQRVRSARDARLSFRGNHAKSGLRIRTYAIAMQAVICVGSMILPARACAEMEETSLMGGGVRTRPAYDGSSSRVQDRIPLIRYFGTPWFLRTSQEILEGGVRTQVGPGLHVGVQLAYEPARETSESRFLLLHHVHDVDYGTSAGAYSEWESNIGPTPTSLLARVRQDTRISHGYQADVRVNAGIFRGGPVEAALFAQTTWASRNANDVLYGVRQEESATTGLPAFQPGSGWSFGSAGLLASVNVASHWVIVGTGERHWLSGHVAHSPLAERSGGCYASVGLAYRF